LLIEKHLERGAFGQFSIQKSAFSISAAAILKPFLA